MQAAPVEDSDKNRDMSKPDPQEDDELKPGNPLQKEQNSVIPKSQPETELKVVDKGQEHAKSGPEKIHDGPQPKEGQAQQEGKTDEKGPKKEEPVGKKNALQKEVESEDVKASKTQDMASEVIHSEDSKATNADEAPQSQETIAKKPQGKKDDEGAQGQDINAGKPQEKTNEGAQGQDINVGKPQEKTNEGAQGQDINAENQQEKNNEGARGQDINAEKTQTVQEKKTGNVVQTEEDNDNEKKKSSDKLQGQVEPKETEGNKEIDKQKDEPDGEVYDDKDNKDIEESEGQDTRTIGMDENVNSEPNVENDDDNVVVNEDILIQQEKNRSPKENIGLQEESESSHFFAYLVTSAILVAVLYVAYHNKRKIIAFALEGRRSRGGRRPNSGEYQRLEHKI
ncbi:trans-Golgi network integral membrane protein 2 isoform X2 [Ranitomeya imitator]|uniref:trans-Golgi network integral membrane protein 2 isoform X2 n=1 Tax=Ranitomeya imitator TaxID=111125 RepID=UPI0037E95E2F